MSATVVFRLGTLGTLLLGIGVITYLRRALETILPELCGDEARAGFWMAAMALGLVPVIFAIS